MNEQETLARARAGDDAAFTELTASYHRELQLHCYRILGSVADAEDLLQETLLAAWRGLESFEGRASVRSWLYRIATRRCLNVLRDSGRRPQEVDVTRPRLSDFGPGTEAVWVEPYPDVLLEGVPDHGPGPEARYETKEAIELAFIVGLQHLPPLQRAALVLRDVLGFRTAEAAEILDTTEASAKMALQRARASIDGHLPARDRERTPLPNSPAERALMARFADAVEQGDVGTIVGLLTEDARLTMPPEPEEFRGPAAIASFLDLRARMRGSPLRVLATRANTQPAFGCYLPSTHGPTARAYGILVIGLDTDRISALTWFSDISLFARFGLPRTLNS